METWLVTCFCLVAQISFSIYLTVFEGLSQRYSAVTINKWMFIYASMYYIPFSLLWYFYDSMDFCFPLVAILQVLYVGWGGSFLAYLCIMIGCQRLLPSYGSQYVQLYATGSHGYDCSNRDGYRCFGWGERDRYRTLYSLGYMVLRLKVNRDWSWKSRKASFQILKMRLSRQDFLQLVKRSQVAFPIPAVLFWEHTLPILDWR